jgi:hypothetical protein
MIMAYRLLLLIALLLPSQMLAQDGSQMVIFLHAGPKLSDPKIRQIAGALFEKGYLVRAPDNDQDVDGGVGVDYFDKSAEKTALDIANLVNDKLRTLGLKSSTDPDLKPRFQSVRNPTTYFGVWLFAKRPN